MTSTGSDQQSRSEEIWAKFSKHLSDEIDAVVYGPWLSSLSFVEARDGVLRLAHPSGFRRDWIMNTYEEYFVDLWRKDDDSIRELEILVQPNSRPKPRPVQGEANSKPEAAAAKPASQAAAAVDTTQPTERTGEQLAQIRKQLGKVGVWSRSPYFYEAAQATNLAKEAEAMGYGSLWIPGFDGGHVFERCRLALQASSKLIVATGVFNIWRHEPADVAQTVAQMRADSNGRFIVAMGGSHRFLIGEEYDKITPMTKMRHYLDDLDSAGLPEAYRMLGALGPKMLALSGQRTAGAHPCFIPPEFTAGAREILGSEPLLIPEVTVILDSNPSSARAYARKFANLYFKGPNYANMLRRFGFTDEDFVGEGSDRLIDAVVAWGDPQTIAARIRAHLDAGADHVTIQSRGHRNEVEVWRELAPLLQE